MSSLSLKGQVFSSLNKVQRNVSLYVGLGSVHIRINATTLNLNIGYSLLYFMEFQLLKKECGSLANASQKC